MTKIANKQGTKDKDEESKLKYGQTSPIWSIS